MGGKPQPTRTRRRFHPMAARRVAKSSFCSSSLLAKPGYEEGDPTPYLALAAGELDDGAAARCYACYACSFALGAGGPVFERAGVSVFLINFWVSCYHACFLLRAFHCCFCG